MCSLAKQIETKLQPSNISQFKRQNKCPAPFQTCECLKIWPKYSYLKTISTNNYNQNHHFNKIPTALSYNTAWAQNQKYAKKTCPLTTSLCRPWEKPNKFWLPRWQRIRCKAATAAGQQRSGIPASWWGIQLRAAKEHYLATEARRPPPPDYPRIKWNFHLRKYRLSYIEKVYKEEALFYMLPKPLCFSFVEFCIYYVHKDLLLSWFAEPLNIFQQIKHSCRITNNQDSQKQLLLCYIFPFCHGVWRALKDLLSIF